MDNAASLINGSKPFRIDTHYHIFPPKFMANQAKRNPRVLRPTSGRTRDHRSQRLEATPRRRGT